MTKAEGLKLEHEIEDIKDRNHQLRQTIDKHINERARLAGANERLMDEVAWLRGRVNVTTSIPWVAGTEVKAPFVCDNFLPNFTNSNLAQYCLNCGRLQYEHQ